MRLLYLAALLTLSLSCKDKKPDLSGNTPLKTTEFVEVFKEIAGNYYAADTNIHKISDTISIGRKALSQFIPDSIIATIIESKKASIHPVGKILKEKEVYLLLTFRENKQIKLVSFAFDANIKYLAFKELLSNNNNDDYHHSVTINREPTFVISREKQDKENTILFTREGWAFNVKEFIVIVSETNEDVKKNNTILNPIDTLPRKNKFSGNYIKDAKNFISVRDGKTASSYLFFIHFEKNNSTCIGELKGEMKLKDAKSAVYTANGDPCIIDFIFSGNEIEVKEQGSCGNHRGIKCFFNDSYIRKKEPVTKKRK